MPSAPPRAPRARSRGRSACGSRASRRSRRCAGWRSATRTNAPDSRARSAVRSRRSRCAPRALAELTNASRTRAMSSASSRAACASCRRRRSPTAQSSARDRRRRFSAPPPSHGRCDDALRPACASWMPSLAVPMRRQCAMTRVQRRLVVVGVEPGAAVGDAAMRARHASPRPRAGRRRSWPACRDGRDASRWRSRRRRCTGTSARPRCGWASSRSASLMGRKQSGHGIPCRG